MGKYKDDVQKRKQRGPPSGAPFRSWCLAGAFHGGVLTSIRLLLLTEPVIGAGSRLLTGWWPVTLTEFSGDLLDLLNKAGVCAV